eukprot:TRINITY_DN8364_c1_g1_i2.p1 TRINITY_DN8364_c1_g1~~TRINITY_DN8364_c1_g1_i2.p1  ORF type:complete len:144 (+),score=6.27 TRINITY_DN8364_c1_g1_i2:176-607(+)
MAGAAFVFPPGLQKCLRLDAPPPPLTKWRSVLGTPHRKLLSPAGGVLRPAGGSAQSVLEFVRVLEDEAHPHVHGGEFVAQVAEHKGQRHHLDRREVAAEEAHRDAPSAAALDRRDAEEAAASHAHLRLCFALVNANPPRVPPS